MKRAFTLIELVVAVAILAMVISFASVIFRVSIEAYRTAGANTEIMQKLRAVTDQLNADFKGLQADAPLLIWFEQEPNDPRQRYDQIMFFANGDFQSIQLYDGSTGEPGDTGEPISGSVARIHYGQAQNDTQDHPEDMPEEDRLLARRQHILTADENLEVWPHDNMLDFDYGRNEWYEHGSLSLAQWKTIDWDNDGDVVVNTCFGFRPLIDMGDPNTYHKLICDGVGSFAIQWSYWDFDDERFYWLPSNDPDGDGDDDDSSFVGNDEFGVYFSVPGTISDSDWPYSETQFTYRAFKFTFTLYDSKGIFENGRRFTHIVYLGD
jgi:prepilin-type N-terminal cleavage/methylation domain-containing protein